MTTYNGWANYETWNVALYIQNDYGLYSLVREWMEDRDISNYESKSYDIFRHTLAEIMGPETPDGVRWDDEKLDHVELTEMLDEL